jgi:hypothetical protein
MVLGPLTALSLVGNIVQFVEFSSKLFGRVISLARSSSGLIDDHKEILFHAERLSADADSFVEIAHDAGPDQDKVEVLVLLCKQLATELMKMVNGFRLEPAGSKLATFRQALRGMLRAPKLQDMIVRVGWLRDLLNAHF